MELVSIQILKGETRRHVFVFLECFLKIECAIWLFKRILKVNIVGDVVQDFGIADLGFYYE